MNNGPTKSQRAQVWDNEGDLQGIGPSWFASCQATLGQRAEQLPMWSAATIYFSLGVFFCCCFCLLNNNNNKKPYSF